MLPVRHSVLLTSYMRPNLTLRTIRRTLNWSGLKKLIVVIDGLRPGASEIEKKWRQMTIEVINDYEDSRKLELWCYDENIGMTEHYLRLQKRVMSEDPSTIWIEEDIDLDFEMFANLNSSEIYCDGPILISGYSHFNHTNFAEKNLKGNLFLPIWGLKMNEEFHELICRTWRDKKFDEKYVESVISDVFPRDTVNQRIYAKSVLSYWILYSKWGLVSSKRWDSLANYALWTVGRFSLSSLNRLAQDVSYLDFRGMNQRERPMHVSNHFSTFKYVGGVPFCIECEYQGSRKSPSITRRIMDSLKYRVGSTYLRKMNGQV